MKLFLLKVFLRHDLVAEILSIKASYRFLISFFKILMLEYFLRIMLINCRKASTRILQNLKIAIKNLLVHLSGKVCCH